MGTGVIFDQVHHGNKRTKIKKANKMLVLKLSYLRERFQLLLRMDDIDRK